MCNIDCCENLRDFLMYEDDFGDGERMLQPGLDTTFPMGAMRLIHRVDLYQLLCHSIDSFILNCHGKKKNLKIKKKLNNIIRPVLMNIKYVFFCLSLF